VTIERKEVRPLRGIRAVRFLSSAVEASNESAMLDDDLLVQVREWAAEHPDVALLRVEFDRWSTHPTGATADERLLNALGFGPSPCTAKHSATLYFEVDPTDSVVLDRDDAEWLFDAVGDLEPGEALDRANRVHAIIYPAPPTPGVVQ
jgi:hypothetical protein